MSHHHSRLRTLLLPTALTLGISSAILVAACAPPPPPAKEAEDISPPGAMEGVEAEAISSRSDEQTAGEPKAEASTKFHALPAPKKMQFMKTTVSPEMKKLFQAYDADEFSSFGCSSCHGSGAKAGNFSMPSKDLPALNQHEMDAHPEMSKFMAEQVVPKMAELLGEELEGEHGFGCFDCHTKKD